MSNDDLDLHGLAAPPEMAYAVVRQRVMAEVRRRRGVRRALRAIAAAVACLALAAAGLTFALRRPAAPAAASVPMLAQAPPPPALALPAVRPGRRVARGPRRNAVRRQPVATQPLFVRLETDDPNVVILWMVD